MRWNQYVYESQMNANRLHHGKLALERYQTNQAIDQVRDRLRNNPERADIYRGDALNVRLRRDQRSPGLRQGPRRRRR